MADDIEGLKKSIESLTDKLHKAEASKEASLKEAQLWIGNKITQMIRAVEAVDKKIEKFESRGTLTSLVAGGSRSDINKLQGEKVKLEKLIKQMEALRNEANLKKGIVDNVIHDVNDYLQKSFINSDQEPRAMGAISGETGTLVRHAFKVNGQFCESVSSSAETYVTAKNQIRKLTNGLRLAEMRLERTEQQQQAQQQLGSGFGGSSRQSAPAAGRNSQYSSNRPPAVARFHGDARDGAMTRGVNPEDLQVGSPLLNAPREEEVPQKGVPLDRRPSRKK